MSENKGRIRLKIQGSKIPKVYENITKLLQDNYKVDNSDGLILFRNNDKELRDILFPIQESYIDLSFYNKATFESVFDAIIENDIIKDTNAVIGIDYILCDIEYINTQIKKFNGAFVEDAVPVCDIIFGDDKNTISRMQIGFVFRK